MREALACNQRPSGRKIAVGEHVLKVTNQTHSVALNRTQMRSVTHKRAARRRAQMHSDALRRAYLLNAIEHPLNLHNLVRFHWCVSRVLTSEQQAVHVARYLMREVIRGHPRANQSQSEPIRAHQSPSAPISANQRQSAPISANQRGSLPVASDLPRAPSAARVG